MTSNRYIPDSVLVRVKATHFNYVNRNSVLYTPKAVREGADSWVKPYKRPYLIGHNKHSDPVGRIVDYQIVQSDAVNEPPDYIELTAKITDAGAIEKVLDGRYCTVSVGSRSSKVVCSECNQNIIEDGLCEHKKGSFNNNGKRIHWLIDQIDYTECSFVNEPADEYAAIDQIDFGTGWIPYGEFLDNRETLIAEIRMEDHIMNQTDAKLSSASRSKLPDSAFCYVAGSGENKVRKFPAHDAAHVRNGLARLNQADLPGGAKSKVLACLRRRAKRYGIKVSTDEFNAETVEFINSVEPTFGLDQDWTEEEIKAMSDFFEKNPNFDELEDNTSTQDDSDDSNQSTEPDKMKKDELLTAYKELKESYDRAVAARDGKIQSLEDKVSELETILIEREDEINKYLDQVAELEGKYRDAVVNNIVDMKQADTTEEREELAKKLGTRQIESLIDTLSDLRNETNQTSIESDNSVDDPTQHSDSAENNDSNDSNERNQSPWDIFSQDNTLVEVE